MSSWVTSALVDDQQGLESIEKCRRPDADDGHAGRSVLVIDGNLLTAEALAFALAQRTFAARFALPVSPTHVRDLTGWRPGVVLLDVDWVERASCTGLVSILSDARIPLVIMCSRLDSPMVGECIDAGASTVVDKRCGLDELVAVITRLLAGGVGLDEDAKRRLLEPIRRQARAKRERLAPFDALTQREKCVLAELVDGHAPEAIARRSSVSILTVRSQIKSILQKLGVNSQLGAVSFALRAGWTLEEAPLPQPRTSRPLPVGLDEPA